MRWASSLNLAEAHYRLTIIPLAEANGNDEGIHCRLL
jgi:hypothetical protein